MPLYDTGARTTDVDFNWLARAKDQACNVVIVVGSTEAVDDLGWDVVLAAASRKYDAGEFEVVAGVPKVRVISSDCRA